MGAPSECRHCCRVGPVHPKHRLCVDCYQHRDLWEPEPPPDADEEEMEEAALEAMIAEQMQRLPKWWGADVRRQQKKGIRAARAEFGRLLWGKRA